MPGLRIYKHESAQSSASSTGMLESHITDDVTDLTCPFCSFITKSSVTMERHKYDIHKLLEPEAAYFSDNLELNSPEKSSSEKDLEIEVLDIDQFGALSNTIEESDKSYSNSEDDHLNNDVICNDVTSYSSVKSNESTSLTSKIIDKNYAKSQVRNYKCHHCGFSTKNSRKHLHHLQDIHNEKFPIHECDFCEYASKHIKNLHRHVHIIHGKKTENDSESSMQLSRKLSKLSKKRKNKKSKKLQCNLCTYTTTSKRNLSIHVICHDQPMKVHNDEIEDINSKIHSIECNGIRNEEDKFDSFGNDEKTAALKHSSSQTQRKYKCPLCKQNFRYVSWILRHLLHNHRGDVQAENLAAAYALKKRKKRPNRTNVLRVIKKISRKKTNPLISPSHSKDRQMEKFGSSSAISKLSVSNNCREKSHAKSHINHNSAVQCNICSYKFKGLLELQEHMKVHSALSVNFSSCDFGVNSVKSYKCDTVVPNQNTPIISNTGKQLAISRNAKNELRTIKSKLKYQCPYCPYIIRSVTRFHIHFIQHMKNLLFRCSDCDYHSSWKWTVVKHIWSKICNEKNHFTASVLTNNELIALRSFKLYKKYRVHFNQPKSLNYQSDEPQVTAQENKITHFQSHKSNIFSYDDINGTDFPNKISPFPSLLSLSVPNPLKETNYYYCKECSFRNVSKQIVINHLASHAGIKPFQCSVCDLKSNWKHVIIRHIRNVHTGQNEVIEKRINFTQDGFVLSRDSVFKSSGKNSEPPDMLSKLSFSCHICPYKTRKEYHMNFHTKQHNYREGANYKCDECPYFVKFAKSLIRHKKLHYDFALSVGAKSDLNVDDESAKKFRSSLYIDKPPKKYIRKKSLACSKCPAQFSQQDRFKRHLELHGKNYRFQCNQCDYSVEGAVNLVKHKRLHEMKEKQTSDCSKSYACPVCPAVFNLKVRYQRHLKLHNKSYTNQHGFSFQGNASLKPKKFHYAKSKPELFSRVSKSITCPKCPTVFTSQGRFSYHLTLHGKNYRFTCSHCDYSVQNAVNMKQHEKSHLITKNQELLDCPIYPENLNDPDKIQEPIAMETIVNSNERKLFICDRCPYYSLNKNAVQNHQRSHWLKQGFECPHCDYSSMQRGSLHSHIKLHLDANKLFPPEAFMKFQSFKIYVQEENGETLVFDDEAMINEKSEMSRRKDDHSRLEETVENIQSHSLNYSESERIDENDSNDVDMNSVSNNLKSDAGPIVILTDIFDKNSLASTAEVNL